MADLLSTSLSALTAFQRAIDLTGHNIANANTPGYSRQVADFSTRVGQGQTNSFIGNGVQVSDIRRMYDETLGQQVQTARTGQARFDVLSQLANRLDVLLADPTTGLNASLQSFFNAVQDVSNDPSSVPARQALLGEANGLAQRFNALDSRLQETQTELNQRVTQSVEDINRLAAEIASVNDQIALAQGRSGGAPNDLLDERDGLIQELSALIDVSTTVQNDGTTSVFIGSGQTLVIGTEVQNLAVQRSEFDPTRLEVVYQNLSGTTALDTNLTGGQLGGLLEFRTRMLDPARQALGETAIALGQQFNEQHRGGLDLRGALGGAFFDVPGPEVFASNVNAGSGTVAVTVSDLGALTGDDYVLDFDGANYTLTNVSTQQAVALSGTGSAADPLVADGLEMVVGGAPAAGDRLLIRSTATAAGSIGVAITDPQAIAMALPTRGQASLNNLGDAQIVEFSTADASDPGLLTPATIEFVSATTYTVNGAGSFSYVDGQPIVINGTQLTVSGTPQPGDQITIEPNNSALGDNGNGLLLAGLQAQGVLDGGSISVGQNYSQLVADVGSSTRQLQENLNAQNVVLQSAENELLAKSGVNLDEEAANLIRFQQAYQAAAQVVSVASTLFDTLISATNR